MNWQDYEEVDHSRYGGIGILDRNYVCTMKVQAQMITQFRWISKEEFDTFPLWKDDPQTWKDLQCQTLEWQGYYLSNELKKCGKGYHHVKTNT